MPGYFAEPKAIERDEITTRQLKTRLGSTQQAAFDRRPGNVSCK
jgi:hypothetical protein